jgi:Tol biopolymer transport system component
MYVRTVGRAAAATVLGAVTTLWVVPVAEAAYPGTNGDVAFSSTRNNDIAIYQVNLADPGIGTASGDASATSELTLGAGDVEPFYSPNGATAYFSSDRDTAGDWAIFSIPANDPESASNPATELSAIPGAEAHNDYSPSVAPDGGTVVFNRDNISIDTLWAPGGESTVCTLYTPGAGLLPDNSSDGSGSRVVFDPVDPTKAIYAGADGNLHLLSGIKFTPGSNPCGQQSTITDTNLSGEAFPAGSQYATGVDAFPDWGPNGQNVVFNSTRGGGDTLFVINDPTGAMPTGYPVIAAQATTSSSAISTEPVFSPDGTEIAFVQSKKGSSIYSEMLIPQTNGTWQASDMEDLSEQNTTGISFDSEPDWQPVVVPGNGQVPESPYLPALPAAAVLSVGSLLGLRSWRSRRRTARA